MFIPEIPNQCISHKDITESVFSDYLACLDSGKVAKRYGIKRNSVMIRVRKALALDVDCAKMIDDYRSTECVAKFYISKHRKSA